MTARSLIVALVVAGMLSGQAGQAWALTAADADYLARLRQVESTNNYSLKNQFGFAGAFQIGVPMAIDAGWVKPAAGYTGGNDWSHVTWTDRAQSAGVTSLETFLSNSNAQDAAMGDVLSVQRRYAQVYGLDAYVGTAVNGRVLTEYDVLAGIHQQGAGAVGTYLSSNGASDSADGNNLRLSSYLDRVNGAAAPAPSGTGSAQPATAALAGAAEEVSELPGCYRTTKAEIEYANLSAVRSSIALASQQRSQPRKVINDCIGQIIQMINTLTGLFSGNFTGAISSALQSILNQLLNTACQMLMTRFNEVVGRPFQIAMALTGSIPGTSPVTISGPGGFPITIPPVVGYTPGQGMLAGVTGAEVTGALTPTTLDSATATLDNRVTQIDKDVNGWLKDTRSAVKTEFDSISAGTFRELNSVLPNTAATGASPAGAGATTTTVTTPAASTSAQPQSGISILKQP